MSILKASALILVLLSRVTASFAQTKTDAAKPFCIKYEKFVILVFPTVEEYHKDSYALNVLSELLRGSKTSPLYKVIVENKKLAPNVSAYQYSKEIFR